MASNTPNLNLLKKDPATDGNDTFNIQTMLNDNWDKIDAAVGEVREELKDINVPDASLTQKGITQLSSATDSTAEDRAATPKAVKSAFDAAIAAQVTANAANTAAASAGNAVGPLSSLLTSAKGNVVSAVNELFTNVNDGKNVIASAIIGRGGTASGSDTFSQLAAAIRNLKGNVAVGIFSTGLKYVTSITETVSGLAFTPRYIIVRAQMILYPVNNSVFLGSISNLPPFNWGLGKNMRVDLASFVPLPGGFTVTVNFTNNNGGSTIIDAGLEDWIAIE